MSTLHYTMTLPDSDALAIATTEQLHAYQEVVASHMKVLKRIGDDINKRIHESYSPAEAGMRSLVAKASGRIEIENFDCVGGGTMRVVSDVTKKVTWLQPPLRTIFGSLPLAQAEKYIDVEFSVKETNYEKLKAELPAWEAEYGASGLVAKLEESRVVKYSEAKISLEKKNG